MDPGRTTLRFRIAAIVGALGLAAWGVVWFFTFKNSALPLGDRMWLRYPVFGADFWSQSAYGTKLWLSGQNPYELRDHLFPYPPLVMRAFIWVNLFPLSTALKLYVAALAALVVAAAVVAHRTRRQLGLSMPPLTLSVFAVLASYPVLFQLERANCDLITVATLLIALPLLARGRPGFEFLAGLVLSVGPWIKFYPGLMGLGLIALFRPWAVLGFAAGGVAIPLSMLTQTEHSLTILRVLMEKTQAVSTAFPYPPWSHSLSLAWLFFSQNLSELHGLSFLSHIPAMVVAPVLVIAAIAPVCLRVFKRRSATARHAADRRRGDPLTYPLLLWICAVASCAPIIANDYSLVFYPLSVVACVDVRDRWFAKAGILASLVFWQPFALPISAWLVLLSKLLGLFGVGASLWQRASASSS